jgi:hypothetical protein
MTYQLLRIWHVTDTRKVLNQKVLSKQLYCGSPNLKTAQKSIFSRTGKSIEVYNTVEYNPAGKKQ